MKRRFPLKTLEDGRILWGGKHQSVLLPVPPVPYSLLDEGARDALLAAFGRFLNTLSFPVQWLFRSFPVSQQQLLPGPAATGEREEAYRRFLKDLIHEHRIMERRLVLALPLTAPEHLAPSQARERVGVVARELLPLGISPPDPLGTVEVASLLSGMMGWTPSNTGVSPLWVDRRPQPLPSLFTDWARSLLPGSLHIGPAELLLDTGLRRTYAVRHLPPVIRDDLLGRLLRADLPLDLSLHIRPLETERIMRHLTARIRQMAGGQALARFTGQRGDHRVEDALAEAETLQARLSAGSTRMFDVSLYISLEAENRESLEERERSLLALAREQLLLMRPCLFQQIEAFTAVLPLALDPVADTHLMTTEALSCFFLPGAASHAATGGTLYGLDRQSGGIVLFDRLERLPNPAAFFLGSPGSGKSALAKAEIYRMLLRPDTDAIILDPEGEYSPLVATLGGTPISLAPGSPHRFNPLELGDAHSFAERQEKQAFLLGFLDQLLGPLALPEKSALDHAIRRMFSSEPHPSFPLLVQALGSDPRTTSLGRSLSLFTEGSLSLFSGTEDVPLTGRVLAFSFRDLPAAHWPLLMPLCLETIWRRVVTTGGKRRTLITIDEVHLLLTHPSSRRLLLALVKRARKWGAVITGITQNLGDFLAHEEGISLLSNADLHVLFNQASPDLPRLARTLALSQAEQEHIRHLPPGDALFLARDHHLLLRTVFSPEEFALADTRPGRDGDERASSW